MENLEYYLALPWTFKVRKVKDESGEYYLGYIQEIPSVRGHGDSLLDCYDLVMEILKSNLGIMLEDGDRIGKPASTI